MGAGGLYARSPLQRFLRGIHHEKLRHEAQNGSPFYYLRRPSGFNGNGKRTADVHVRQYREYFESRDPVCLSLARER
jgi:hypothetical protein